MFKNWWFYLILSLILDIVYNLFLKKALKKNVSDGALISLLQITSGLFILIISLFFKWSFSSDIKVYLLLFASCIFYALSDRVNATSRSGLEVSMYGILSQLTPIFTFTWGIILFKEPIIITKIIGLLLIIAGNIFVLYKKGKFTWNKYVLFSILGSLFFSIGLCIDVDNSEHFNLPFYVAITLIVPSLLIIIAEKIKVKDLINEYKVGDKKSILVITAIWGIRLYSMYRAFQLGEFSTVTVIRATSILLNVIAGYFFLKEKDSVYKKIVAAILVAAGVILAKL